MFLKNLFSSKSTKVNTDLLSMNTLNIIYFTASGQNAPFVDKDNNIWALSNSSLLNKVVKQYGNSWMVLPQDLSVKQIGNADIQTFINTMYYHYGCQNIVLDDAANIINLSDKLSIPASHFDKSEPNHEVVNPKVRRLILRFNQTIASKFGVSEDEKEKLIYEYLKELNGCEILIPYKNNADGKMELYIGGTLGGTPVKYAYTDFEAIPTSIRDNGFINGMVQPFDSIIDSAIAEKQPIALNLNSNGGGLFIPLSDMDVIKNGGTIKVAKEDDVNTYFAEALKYHSGRGVKVDMKKAVELYTKAAELGNPYAQNNLGVILFNGYDNVAPNVSEAMKWIVPAAEKVADAAFMLARNYDLGTAIGQDLALAAKYYEKASDMGHADAAFNLGVMYLNGEGVPKNQAKAIELIKKGAELGSPNASAALKQLGL